MNIYKYDELTKEYTGVETAQLDPLESKVQGKEVYLLPANATFTAPLVTQDGYVPVWGGNAWEYKEDNRGKKYWLVTDEYGTPAREMKELGAFPVNAVFEAPQKPFEMAKAEKLTEVDQWTANKITGGFVSTCYNGENILYDTDTETQLTMTKARANCEGERFAQAFPNGMGVRGYAQTGTDADGTMVFANTKTVYNFLPEHIIAWDEDFSLHLAKCKYEGWMMQDKVNACTTKEELESIALE